VYFFGVRRHVLLQCGKGKRLMGPSIFGEFTH